MTGMGERLKAIVLAGGKDGFTPGALLLVASVAFVVAPVVVVASVVAFGSDAFGASVTFGAGAGVVSVFWPEIL